MKFLLFFFLSDSLPYLMLSCSNVVCLQLYMCIICTTLVLPDNMLGYSIIFQWLSSSLTMLLHQHVYTFAHTQTYIYIIYAYESVPVNLFKQILIILHIIPFLVQFPPPSPPPPPPPPPIPSFFLVIGSPHELYPGNSILLTSGLVHSALYWSVNDKGLTLNLPRYIKYSRFCYLNIIEKLLK